MTSIAICLGDPNGIGPEIALKAALRFVREPGPRPVLVGDGFVLREAARLAGLDVAFAAPDEDWPGALALHDVAALEPAGFAPGTVDARAGRATVAYVEAAVRLAERGAVAAILACPHSETAVNRAGIPFSGYGGLVADLTGTPRDKTFLMLDAAGLRIAHVTLHESVAHALARLSPQLVAAAGEACAAALRRLGTARPRLGVFGINPHAGEGGLFGDEDERITRPAVDLLRAAGVAADGPVGADLMLSERGHDAYLAMFHDQGHIPIKLLSPRRASAVVIGVPLLFASVAHGAAFDIAGRGIAEADGAIEAFQLLAGVARP